MSDEIIDRLYGLPLEEFTQARNTAASGLRKAGQREAADQVKALRKPTLAAGAVNRLVREHRGEVEQFLQAAAALRDAQFSGKGDLAAASRREHEALERLTGLGGEAVRQTLLAAAVDDEAAHQVLAARLERELEPRGFGTLLAHAPSTPVKLEHAERSPGAAAAPAPRPKPAAAEAGGSERRRPEKPEDGAARAKLDEAKSALRAAEAEEQQARRHWERTKRDVEDARADVDKARRDLDRPLR